MTTGEEILERAVGAARAFRRLDQKQTDAAVRAAYLAALDARVRLAKMAQEETGIGVWRHKVIKNVIASRFVYDGLKRQKTVGAVSEDPRSGLVEVALPLGPILGLIPFNNPTSTTIFKILICLKTRNPLIISPHQAARHSIAASAEICYRAALAAGAPPDCVLWLDRPAPETVEKIMSDPRLALILATGTHTLVHKANLSGTPVIGVGPGNVPVYIGASADVPFAVRSIIESKTFDNGSVCASEQALVVRKAMAEPVIGELKREGAYFLSPGEAEKVGRVAYDPERKTMTPAVVGQPVQTIARMAGLTVPDEAVLLIARLEGVGRNYPLSAEILAPILAFYVEEDFDAAIGRCSDIARFGGRGHTAVIYSNNPERIDYFSRAIDAGRILVNTPSTHGALGGVYNSLDPSFTLGTGAGGHNITTDNITARHLLNIQRIARRRPNPKWAAFPMDKLFDEAARPEEIECAFDRNF